MDRKHIISELKHNLQKVSQIIAMIENYDQANAGVELDLMQKNITILFENYVKLRMSYENAPVAPPAKPVEPVAKPKVEPEPVPEPPVAKGEPKSEEPSKKGFGFNFNLGDDEGKINRTMESKPEEITAKKEGFNLDNAINEALNIALNQASAKPKTEPKAEPKKEEVETDKDQTLNERFSSMKKDVNLANKHLNTPIADLAKEISLNKKFAFVNELFDGNMEQYNAAIQQLNTIGSIEFAHKYVNELRARLKWDRENAIVDDFIDLVERRWEK